MVQNNPSETPRPESNPEQPRSKLLEKAKRFLRLVEQGSRTNDFAEKVGTDLANADLANLVEASKAEIAEMREGDINELSDLIHTFRKDGLKPERVQETIRRLLEDDQRPIDEAMRFGGLHYKTIDLRNFRRNLEDEMRREATFILEDERNWSKQPPKDKIEKYLSEKFKKFE